MALKIPNPFKIIFGRTDKVTKELYELYSKANPDFNLDKAGGISTVHTCVKILGDTLGRLPVGVYSYDDTSGRIKDKAHYLYDLIHYNPNTYLTSQAFFSSLEVTRNLSGNSFARIFRDANARVQYLEIIPPSQVVGYTLVNNELYYKLKTDDDNKEEETVSSTDMLHFKGVTKNGIWGVNPLEALRLNLSSSWQALNTIDTFFKQGALSPYAIKSTVAGANQQSMLEALDKFKKQYGGSANAGQLLPLPPNTELQGLSINMADAAFIDLVKFNDGQIGALYGVPLFMLGSPEASKYNDIEQNQLSFKANTVAAITRMYRQELEFKLLTTKERASGSTIEFNINALVETDYKTKVEGYKAFVGMAAMSPQDVQKLEGIPTYPGAEKHYIQKQYIAVEDMGKETNTKI